MKGFFFVLIPSWLSMFHYHTDSFGLIAGFRSYFCNTKQRAFEALMPFLQPFFFFPRVYQALFSLPSSIPSTPNTPAVWSFSWTGKIASMFSRQVRKFCLRDVCVTAGTLCVGSRQWSKCKRLWPIVFIMFLRYYVFLTFFRSAVYLLVYVVGLAVVQVVW